MADAEMVSETQMLKTNLRCYQRSKSEHPGPQAGWPISAQESRILLVRRLWTQLREGPGRGGAFGLSVARSIRCSIKA